MRLLVVAAVVLAQEDIVISQLLLIPALLFLLRNLCLILFSIPNVIISTTIRYSRLDYTSMLSEHMITGCLYDRSQNFIIDRRLIGIDGLRTGLHLKVNSLVILQ
jgi:hypothetical protein